MNTRNWILCYYEIAREHTKASCARARSKCKPCVYCLRGSNGKTATLCVKTSKRDETGLLVWRATKRAATNEKLYDFLRLVQQRISQIPTKSRCGEKVALNIQSIGNNWRSLTWLVHRKNMFCRRNDTAVRLFSKYFVFIHSFLLLSVCRVRRTHGEKVFPTRTGAEAVASSFRTMNKSSM